MIQKLLGLSSSKSRHSLNKKEMIEIKKYYKHILPIASILSLCIFCNSLNISYANEIQTSNIDEVVENIDLEYIDTSYSNILEKIKSEDLQGDNIDELLYIKDNLSSSIDKIEKEDVFKDSLYKVYFILGMGNYYEYENELAIEYFEKGLKYREKNNEDLITIEMYLKLSNIYIEIGEFDKSLNYFKQAENLMKSNNYTVKLAKSYSQRATNLMFFVSEEKEEIKTLIENSLRLIKEIDDKLICADLYSSAATIYSQGLNNNIQAVDYFIQAMNIYNELNEISSEVDTAINLAVLYMQMEDYIESINILNSFIKNKETINLLSPETNSTLYSTLTTAYTKTNQFKKANESIKEAQKYENYINEIDKVSYKAVNLLTKADLLSAEGKGEEALNLINEAEKIYNDNINTFLFFAFDMLLLEEKGDAYFSMKEYSESTKIYQELLSIANEYGLTSDIMNYNKKISDSYKKEGNINKALEYLEKYEKLRSEEFENSNRNYTEKVRTEFETDKKEKEIEILNKKAEIQKNKIYITSIVGTGVSIFAMYAWINSKKISRLNNKLKSLSITDGLTGISNRRALDEFINEQWIAMNGIKNPVSAIMIDIDCFKLYNDNYGHQKGDEILASVAKAIESSCLRKSDTNIKLESKDCDEFVARYGGEEFVVILMNTDAEGAKNIANRIKENVAALKLEHEFTKADSKYVTLSMGIATEIPTLESNSSDLIKKADEALYYSKENGRNRFTHIKDI